jgi:hypothetical protein
MEIWMKRANFAIASIYVIISQIYEEARVWELGGLGM